MRNIKLYSECKLEHLAWVIKKPCVKVQVLTKWIYDLSLPIDHHKDTEAEHSSLYAHSDECSSDQEVDKIAAFQFWYK